jgi:fatty-acyl-CoA synthase
MIISGGENIYSREVEDVLFEHPKVLDAAVIGEPDDMWGERVVAFIVKKDESLTAEELDHFCKGHNRLARFKRPRRYEFVKQLPRNASGKLQKYILREQVKIQG